MSPVFKNSIIASFLEGYHGLPDGITDDAKKQISKVIREEIENNKFEDTAWLNALSDADGDQTKAKGKYIKYRFDQLFKEFETALNDRINAEKMKEKAKQYEISSRSLQDKQERSARLMKDKYRNWWLDDKSIKKLSTSDFKKYERARLVLLNGAMSIEDGGPSDGEILMALDDIEILWEKLSLKVNKKTL